MYRPNNEESLHFTGTLWKSLMALSVKNFQIKINFALNDFGWSLHGPRFRKTSAQINTLCSEHNQQRTTHCEPILLHERTTVFRITATWLPQPQELHTSGVNSPVVTKQGLLIGLKQGTPKCHSGTNHWNIWILYITTLVWALPHTCQQEIVSERNPRTYGSVMQAYWELYQSTGFAAGQCFTNSVRVQR
jgi:hypothetical protein